MNINKERVPVCLVSVDTRLLPCNKKNRLLVVNYVLLTV